MHKSLILVISLFWAILLENGTNVLGVLMELGGGLEIRVSLILKLIILLVTADSFLRKKANLKQVRFLLFFMFFLLLSTLSVAIIKPEFLVQSLSVCFHILLVLSIILYFSSRILSENELKKFYYSLRIFGLVNAVLVIVSFIAPTLLSTFEAGTSESGITRAFGIMGDEVSLFLTFFVFDSLIFKKTKSFLLFFSAVLLTGGIGASITLISLVIYFLFQIKKVHKKYFALLPVGILTTLAIGYFFLEHLANLAVVQRAMLNVNDPEAGTGNLRLISLNTALGHIQMRPAFGVGFGAYGSHIKDIYEHVSDVPLVILSSSFNPYIQIASEAGIFGLMLFIILLISFLKNVKLFQNTANSQFVAQFKTASHGWLLIFFITCLSANWFLPSSFLFLLIVVLVGMNLKLNQIQIEQFSE